MTGTICLDLKNIRHELLSIWLIYILQSGKPLRHPSLPMQPPALPARRRLGLQCGIDGQFARGSGAGNHSPSSEIFGAQP